MGTLQSKTADPATAIVFHAQHGLDQALFKQAVIETAYAVETTAAQALTFGVTLLVDLVSGLTAGVVASLLLHIWHSSRPHIATLGHVTGTEHYRNVLRHEVVTHPEVLGLRPDESLFFANARFLEDHVAAAVAAHPALRHVVLQCNAINDIDASALESLEAIDQRLRDAGLCLNLSEVKGPVMDRLQTTDFLKHLSGKVYLTHYQAVSELAPEVMTRSEVDVRH